MKKYKGILYKYEQILKLSSQPSHNFNKNRIKNELNDFLRIFYQSHEWEGQRTDLLNLMEMNLQIFQFNPKIVQQIYLQKACCKFLKYFRKTIEAWNSSFENEITVYMKYLAMFAYPLQKEIILQSDSKEAEDLINEIRKEMILVIYGTSSTLEMSSTLSPDQSEFCQNICSLCFGKMIQLEFVEKAKAQDILFPSLWELIQTKCKAKEALMEELQNQTEIIFSKIYKENPINSMNSIKNWNELSVIAYFHKIQNDLLNEEKLKKSNELIENTYQNFPKQKKQYDRSMLENYKDTIDAYFGDSDLTQIKDRKYFGNFCFKNIVFFIKNIGYIQLDDLDLLIEIIQKSKIAFSNEQRQNLTQLLTKGSQDLPGSGLAEAFIKALNEPNNQIEKTAKLLNKSSLYQKCDEFNQLYQKCQKKDETKKIAEEFKNFLIEENKINPLFSKELFFYLDDRLGRKNSLTQAASFKKMIKAISKLGSLILSQNEIFPLLQKTKRFLTKENKQKEKTKRKKKSERRIKSKNKAKYIGQMPAKMELVQPKRRKMHL